MSDNPTNETALVRISTEAHAMLREIATSQRRTLGAQAELIIEMAWNNMQTNTPTPVSERPIASAHYATTLTPLGG